MAILSEAYTIFELVYDSMYELNLDGSFTLSLAESVEVSDDGLVYTYKIRDGIKWHDGTAADRRGCCLLPTTFTRIRPNIPT